MRLHPSVMLLEFNELSPSLMLHFMEQGWLPNFQRLYHEAEVYITDAEEKSPYLEPWIQWVTVHSGLSYRQHGVFHQGEGHKLKDRCIWDILSDSNFRVAVCGSMNSRYDLPLNGYVLPDPWTTGAAPYPDTLLPYFRFVQRNVQEHTNDRVPLSRSDYIKFVNFMVTHGLSVSTVVGITKQLLFERGGKDRWKRAVILDKLQFDLFRWFHRKLNPHFSTFFLNSTAHLQHMYWRNMEPQLFKIKPTAEEQAEFESAILFGYQEMDKLVGRFAKLAGEDTTLIFCTALGQQPCLTYEEMGGKSFYRPRDFEDLLAFAGITAPHTVAPVMSEEFQVFFEWELDACEAEQRLQAVQIAGRGVLIVRRKGAAIFSGCGIFEGLPHDTMLKVAGSEDSRPFFEIFYQIEGRKSGMHHPDGMLWIRNSDRKHIVHKEKVPLTFIAPTILKMFSVPKPSSMGGEPLQVSARLPDTISAEVRTS